MVCKVLDEEKPGKAVLIFNHGLGDFVLFLPLFEKLCEKYKNWDIKIGFNPERNYKYLYPNSVILNSPYGKYSGIYDVLFGIFYPEPPRNREEFNNFTAKFTVDKIETITKPYLCNKIEIGLKNFKWTPFKFPFKLNNKNSKRIGVHFFGHTSIANKDASYSDAEIIWNEIINYGYEPYEIQMIPLEQIPEIETPGYINKNNSLRYEFPNLRLMVDEIVKCKYFVGVDSGPIYLSGSILGFDKVIGLEKLRLFNKVLPVNIKKVDINNYIPGYIKSVLEELDANN
jgi:hypothetical protein